MLPHPFPPTVMLLEETHVLHNLGKVLMGQITHVLAMALFYGVFILLFCISTVTFFRRNPTPYPKCRWAMFFLTVITFCLATLTLAAKITSLTILIRSPLVDAVNLPLATMPYRTNILLVKSNLIILCATNLLPVINDFAIVWRASALFKFPDQRWLMVMPLSLLVGTVGTMLTYLCMVSRHSRVNFLVSGDINDSLILAAISLSMFTNGVTTSLIIYKLWFYRKTASSLAISLGRPSVVQSLLCLLVESGVISFALQLAYWIINVIPIEYEIGSPQDITAHLFSAMYLSFTVMYPTVVVTLIYMQQSLTDKGGFSSAPEA